MYNKQFARDVCNYAVRNGYNPYASHLFFPQFLDDKKDSERNMGINFGLEWGDCADEIWFCYQHKQNFENSTGMRKAEEHWKSRGKTIRYMCFDGIGNLLHEDKYPDAS